MLLLQLWKEWVVVVVDFNEFRWFRFFGRTNVAIQASCRTIRSARFVVLFGFNRIIKPMLRVLKAQQIQLLTNFALFLSLFSCLPLSLTILLMAILKTTITTTQFHNKNNHSNFFIVEQQLLRRILSNK